MIKLTNAWSGQEEPVYVNPSQILWYGQAESGEGTRVQFSSGPVYVTESLEEISRAISAYMEWQAANMGPVHVGR